MPNGQSSTATSGNEYPLPDGRILVLPTDLKGQVSLNVSDRAFLRSALGPEGYSQMQAHLATRQPLERAAQEESGRQAKLGERIQRAGRSPTPVTGAASVMYAPMAAARSLVGSKVGSTLGRRVGGQYGELAGGAVGGMVGALPGPRTLAQRALRGPGGTGEVTINPMTAATRELEATVPRNEPPGARQEMQMDLGQQSSDAIARENLAQRAATRQAARAGKAVPVAQSPGPYRGPRPGATAGTAEGAPATDITAPGAPNLSRRASQRLVLTPEEAASQDRLQQIAAEEARRRGMRSAAWGQQGQL